ncbi:M3 family metallopeptidase [Piscinibacter sakaiensis]|uniref:M3 family metallopeptidase n=1 Tax=Piscinibacter sakaiensis TaxID=1547922 RepID=UPI003AAB9B7B
MPPRCNRSRIRSARPAERLRRGGIWCRWLLLVAALLWQPALAADPAAVFPSIASPAALATLCRQNLAQARTALQRLEQRRPGPGWLAAYDGLLARLEDLSAPLLFLSAVHPDKAMRDASEACELRWNDFYSMLGQNRRLFAAVLAVRPADFIDAELRRTTVDGFIDSGVALPAAGRTRAKRLSDRISELGQVFDRNIRDDKTLLPFDAAELSGVPADVWQQAPRDVAGRYLLGLSYPVYMPVMQSAEQAATRRRMWLAKTNEGGAANLQLLRQITDARKAYAGLFGFDSWAAFVLRRQMAETPQRARAFLDEVGAAVVQRERAELEQLRLAKADHLGQPAAAVELDRWDIAFYTERVRRQRHAVDQDVFRNHFPPEQILQFVLRVIEKLMGVRYQRIADAGVWHPEVQTYAVSDAASGKRLATLWVDLYPRDGKYNHAAVWSLRSGSAATGRLPAAALVVNVDRKGLTLDELETLLHELGHAVHNNLSATRYAAQAGTSVKRDFVEAPSQMLEDWVYDKRVLALFAEICPACTPVPEGLIEKADVARRFGKGIFFARQHLYANFDLALYGRQSHDPLALWSALESGTPLGHVAGTMFPAGFSHIAGGYSASYYGYLWSLVVAKDLRTAFAADKLDPEVGARFRRTVLANGSQQPPELLLRAFLGRSFDSRAFFDDLQR